MEYINKAADWVGDQVEAGADWVGDAVETGADWAGDAAQEILETGGELIHDGGDAVGWEGASQFGESVSESGQGVNQAVDEFGEESNQKIDEAGQWVNKELNWQSEDPDVSEEPQGRRCGGPCPQCGQGCKKDLMHEIPHWCGRHEW